ncbi:GumC family protein [Laspinema olomoucense]|uniref:Tyrosine kinase G-rich domain-containing protein n=1 Tax=Laspinema olomoucense D3b TaxID=2953688 RepID=A0ABT2NEJ9_9CYAN|nr:MULTISPECIES: hypothetical protein [unclassified Laspinema]MCT7973540.1 hypothetical protein [Laspinema sp. D3d]MCT7981124.1 hypothetical protein [Laspinema sp. D3b]MCT7995083.1 hypothetical protein [Laspinema sp. D3c]
MNDAVKIFSHYNSKSGSVSRTRRWPIYLFLGITSNLLVWGLAIAYITLKAPSYTTKWSITLPSTGSTSRVDLPGIGIASSQTDSPYRYDSHHDPRENYKYIAGSDEVRTRAAQLLNLDLKAFNKPKIEIIGNSTLMEFEIVGDSPKRAQQKAGALHQAFELQLEKLRQEELTDQDRNLQMLLSQSQQNLERSQARLSEYQVSSSIISSEQLVDLSKTIEALRKQKAEVDALNQQSNARLVQITQNLELSPAKANDAFALQSDALFQDTLLKYQTARGELTTLTSVYTPRHPVVLAKQQEIDQAREQLTQRSQQIVGRPFDPEVWEQTNLGSGDNASTREVLFQELITFQTENVGLEAQSQELGRQIESLENRLKTLSVQGSELENLRRDVQIAEAVFSSTLTQLDISKSNIFASYPRIQMLTPPALPQEPSSPKKVLALLGAGMSSVFFTAGFFLLWMRDVKNQRRKQTAILEPKPQPIPVNSAYPQQNSSTAVSKR